MKYLRWFSNAVKPHVWPLVCMMSCHVLLACCAIAFVYVSKSLVDAAVARTPMLSLAIAMVVIIVFRILLNAFRTYLQTRTEIRLKNSLRQRLFDVLLHLENDGSLRHHSGDVINRLQEDVRQVSSAFASALPNLAGTCLQLAAAFVFLLVLDARLALVILIVVPFGILTGKFITSRVRTLTHDIRKSDSKIQSHLQESIQHQSLIQSMEYSETSASALVGLQGELYGNELRRTRFSVLARIFVSLAFQAGNTTAFLWGVWGISSGTVTYGMMTAFLQLVGQIQRPIIEMSNQVPALIHATASIDRLIELESLPRESTDDNVLLSGTAGVRVVDISFSYPDSGRKVFGGFSWDFKPGSRTAIVGPTGVGKSTLIRLILALLKPDGGTIEFYSENDESVTASSASRCNVVYVPQGNSLFSGTVRDNLLMGNPDATDEQMAEALRIAAADFVFQLPGGMDSQCFEAGAGLSEGQAQRIAIARALLRPGSVLLLDEFSSALDAQTEIVLMERLTQYLPDHTMIFITHREKIIEYCDSLLNL